MKKLILAASLIGIAFISCKKNDDGGGGNNAAIVGKWNWDMNQHSVIVSGDSSSLNIDTLFVNNGSYMQFTSDGKIYSYTIDSIFGTSKDTGFYRVTGNSLYLFNGVAADTTRIQISKLTTHELELYAHHQDTVSGHIIAYYDWMFLSK